MRTATSKKLLSMIMAICLVFGSAAALPKSTFTDSTAVKASAQDEQEGPKVENGFSYTEEDGVIVLKRYEGEDTDVTVPAKLGGKSVQVINYDAFSGREDIKSVTLPEGIKQIRGNAFADCRGLETIKLPQSLTFIDNSAFNNCEKLTELTLPSKLEKIEDYAFHNTGIKSITIPDSVKELGVGVFSDCQPLTTAVLGKGLTVIPDALFEGCEALTSITIPKGYTELGPHCFGRCSQLKNITLPDGIKTIGECALGQTAIEKITLPKSVDTLGSWAFDSTKIDVGGINLDNIKHMGREVFLNTPWFETMKKKGGLIIVNDILVDSSNFKGKTLTVPNTIREIAGQGISHVANLETVVFPASVKIIGDNAFDSDEKLTSLSIPKTVEKIGTSITFLCPKFASYTVDKDNKNYTAVDSILFTKDMKTLLDCPTAKKITEYKVPDTVTVIGESAFAEITSLTKITLPAGLKVLSTNSLCNTSLKELELPDGLTEIGEWAIAEQKNLRKIVIPSTVEEIGRNAFFDDAKLSEVFMSEGVRSISDEAFVNCPSLKSVLIPYSVENIGWNAFGLTYKERPDDDPEMIVDKNFTIYAYSQGGPGHWYAHDTGVKFQLIAQNIRMAGSDRYATAAQISYQCFDEADTVVIASGENFPDALAGASLASANAAPILLTAKKGFTKDTLDEIKRLKATKAIILGGEGVLGKNIETSLKSSGIKTIERLGGKDRFETATPYASPYQH